MTQQIRQIPQPDGNRVETGPVQFGNDWPGVFIRGDACLFLASTIEELIKTSKEFQSPNHIRMLSELSELLEWLESSRVSTGKDGRLTNDRDSWV